jgi:hypothetical protein
MLFKLICVLLAALSALAIPNPLNRDLFFLAKRQTDPENPGNADTCTDICTIDPECIEVCSPATEATGRVCTNVCNYGDLSVSAGQNFCLTVGTDPDSTTASNGQRTGQAIFIRDSSITAGGDITLRLPDRSPDGVVLLYMENLELNVGGQLRIDSGDGPRCIGDNCRVIVYAQNVRYRSALTGGQQRLITQGVYNSELDRALNWQ